MSLTMHVELGLGRDLQRRSHIGSGVDVIAAHSEEPGEILEGVVVIVDQEHSGSAG